MAILRDISTGSSSRRSESSLKSLVELSGGLRLHVNSGIIPNGWAECSSAEPAFKVFADSVLEGSIVDRFENIARQYAGQWAIRDSALSMTYAELSDRVDHIAGAVSAATAGRTGPAIIHLPANAEFAAAMLGVLAAGRAFIPLDEDFPPERNQAIVSASGASAVISASHFACECAPTPFSHLPTVDIRNLPDTRSRPNGRIGPDDLAVILYTSGSTARPKGIALNHRALLYGTQQNTNSVHISSSDRILLLSSPSTAAGSRSIFNALLNGACLHMVRPRDWSPQYLANEIRNRSITFLSSIPMIVRHIAECVDPDDRLNDVRTVCLGGDRLAWTDVDRCRTAFSPDVQVYARFGSTECGTYLHWIIDDKPRSAHGQPPAGRPGPAHRLTIMGDNGEPAPIGESGEIVVSSRYIASGYWRGADRQVLAFPTDAADPTARVFATGDLGRLRPDGLVEFVGRKDQQIKLHGHRIELDEIESIIIDLPAVNNAAVVVRSNALGIPQAIVAYVILQPGTRGLLPRHMQTMLAQRLPHYAVPAIIIFATELPRLPNFKVDKQALSRLDAAHRDKTNVPPANALLAEILRLFETVIGVRGATADDTVASLGGDSLQELALVTEIERRYEIAIPEDLIAQRPTIREIADRIGSGRILRRSGSD